MSNKVDKLFKDKLEDDSLQPSAQAWEKIEAHLGKKNKMVFWARVAAAVTLLGLLTFVGVNLNDEDKKEIVKEESGGGSQESGGRSQESGVRSRESGRGSREPARAAVEKRKEIKKQKAQPKAITPLAEEPVEQIAVVPEPEVIPENKIESQPDLTPHTSQPTSQKGITLTYSLPAVKKQDTPKEPLVAEQKEEQKKSGFNRVMEIAKEVKNGDALGELRQAKDDIFALDFKKDKDKKKQ